MASGVPVLCQHHHIEIIHHGVDGRHDLVTASNRQRATGAKVILRVDHDQGVHERGLRAARLPPQCKAVIGANK